MLLLSLRDVFDEAEQTKLREAMNWVIPPDTSPGAGTDAGALRLIALVDALGPNMVQSYTDNLSALTIGDLQDPAQAFAATFVEHVRDVYYAYPDTGSWGDVGFVVSG